MHAFTPFSQFSNGCCRHLTVLPLRQLNAAFSQRIFYWHNEHPRQSLTTADLLIRIPEEYQDAFISGDRDGRLSLDIKRSSKVSVTVKGHGCSIIGTITVENGQGCPNLNVVVSCGQGSRKEDPRARKGFFLRTSINDQSAGSYDVQIRGLSDHHRFTTIQCRFESRQNPRPKAVITLAAKIVDHLLPLLRRFGFPSIVDKIRDLFSSYRM